VEKPNSEIEISIDDIKTLNPANTLLFGLFNPFGFTEAILSDLVNHLEGQPGKIFLSPSHQIILDRGRLIVSPKQRPHAPDIQIGEDQTVFTWSNESYQCYSLPSSGYKINRSNDIVQLDHRKLIFPLRLRTWRKGDYFYPLGMKGKKKLSDYFIEQKIPRQRKESIGVLENGNGDIVWISGYRSDERYKIRHETEKIFILERQMLKQRL
jgi:tRNA(Ile)-lysidine synthase